MGSRPSTPNSPGEARESRSRIGHPNEGDHSSNDVVGPVEPILGLGDFVERREVPGSDAPPVNPPALETLTLLNLRNFLKPSTY